MLFNTNLQTPQNENLPYIEPKPTTKNGVIIWKNPQLNSLYTPSTNFILSVCKELESGKLTLSSVNDIAYLLEVPIGQLLHLVSNKNNNYESFPIKKKRGGVRIIHSPKNGLAILQNKLKIILEYFYKPKKAAHGFIKGKSIITNAFAHTQKKYVVNIDLENYFDTITFPRIYGIFKNKPFNFPPKVAKILASLCTYNNVLPQGASTSPILANLVSSSLDKNLTHFAKKYYVTYTRYADDITFSFNQTETKNQILSYANNQIILNHRIISIIENNGFKINFQKLRIQKHSERQVVTGLVVNKKVNIYKKYLRTSRAMIHNWQYDKVKAASTFVQNNGIKTKTIDEAISKYRKHIYGRLSFIKMIKGNDSPAYLKLMATMSKNDPDKTAEGYRAMTLTEKYDVFICYASEDRKEIATPIHEALTSLNINTFIDYKGIRLGESITQKINNAIAQADFVIAILSKDSIGKSWPTQELLAVLSRDIQTEKNQLITVIQEDAEDAVLNELPLLAGKLYHLFKDDPEVLATKIKEYLSHN